MKYSGRCPKCQANKIYYIETERDPVCNTTNGFNLRPATTLTLPSAFLNRKTIGQIQTCICATCGYVEYYAVNYQQLEELAQNPAYGVKIIVGAPTE
jgi:hypothetical protein